MPCSESSGFGGAGNDACKAKADGKGDDDEEKGPEVGGGNKLNGDADDEGSDDEVRRPEVRWLLFFR